METLKLAAQGVTKTFRRGRQSMETLAGIDLTVENGEFVTVIGPSGCGKSTLFNIIAGIEQPDAGLIAIDGEADRPRAGRTGYMPQQPLLLPWKTVEENVMLGSDVRRVPRKVARDEAHELLETFRADGVCRVLSRRALRRHAPARRPAAHRPVQ